MAHNTVEDRTRDWESPDGAFPAHDNLLMREEEPMREEDLMRAEEFEEQGECRTVDPPEEEDDYDSPQKCKSSISRRKVGKEGHDRGKKLTLILSGTLIILLCGAYICWEIFDSPPSVQPLPAVNAPQQDKRPISRLKKDIAATFDVDNPMAVTPFAADMEQQNADLNAQVRNKAEENTSLKDILARLEGLRASVERLEKKPAVNKDSGEMERKYKDILAAMTGEIQELDKERKDLQARLEDARAKLSALKEENDSLKASVKKNTPHVESAPRGKAKDKPLRSAAKASDSSAAVPRNAAQGIISSWEILGFSGNRVVLNDGKGTHSINVGESYGGVKVLSIDVESGDVKTSAGTLRYGR